MEAIHVIFTRLVSAALIQRVTRCQSGSKRIIAEMETVIRLCIQELSTRQASGETFSMSKHSRFVESALAHPDLDSNGVFAMFSEYCYLQIMIINLVEVPDLIIRLHEVGLGEWALLDVDRTTLRDYAVSMIERLEQHIAEESRLPLGTERASAELVAQVSFIFQLPVSEQVGMLARRYLNQPEEGARMTEISPQMLN